MIAQLSKSYIKNKPSKAFSRLVSYLFFEGRPLAAKGQFINPLLLFFYQFIQLFPQLKKITKPVFIIGMGRSGTTVLGKILSLHSELGFLNEPKALWYFSNNSDDIIGTYTDHIGKYCMNETDANKSVKNKIHKLYAFYLRSIFSKRVLDKYPEMIFRTEYIKQIFPDAKFVFIYRNGWDTASSSAHWSEKNTVQKHDDEVHDWWGKNNRKWNLLIDQVAQLDEELKQDLEKLKPLTKHMDKSAIEWILTMKRGNELMQENDPAVLPIKYEELTSHPHKVLTEIFSFCELEYQERVVQYALNTLTVNKAKPSFHITEPFDSSFNNLMQKFSYKL